MRIAMSISLLLALAAPARVLAQAPAPATPAPLATEVGQATYYAASLQGARTASGERLDNEALVAAHPRWPFGTMVRVTSIENGKQVVVRIIDRGPTPVHRKNGVVIDLSRAAARALDFVREGRAQVRLEVVRWGSAP